MKYLSFLLLSAFLCIVSCKSTKKLFDEGQYDRAVFSALDDLRKNPNNVAAVQILPQAYAEVTSKYETAIRAASSSSVKTSQRLESIYQHYRSLQRMYDAIAATPAAWSLVTPRDYSVELTAAADAAAEFRYQQGLEYLAKGDRESARKAYESLRLADRYVPGYKDVLQKKQEAYDLTTINIVVSKFDQRFGYYNINGSFWQNDVLWNLNNIGNNYYYKFYDEAGARAAEVRVDQYMELMMYDIWFGQLARNHYSYEVSKSITIPAASSKDSPQTVTVKATVYVTRRIIDSRAVMDCRVTDAASQRSIYYDRFPAQYTWENLTGKYEGDSRALSDRDWAIIRGAFNDQPSYDDLYRELTRRVMSDFTMKMRNIYGR